MNKTAIIRSAPSTTALVRIAHRGGGVLATENCVRGIELALTHSVEMVEVDVRRSRDGVLVLSHDDIPHSAHASIAGSTLAELRADAPDIATLDEALDAVRGRARINLDIKDGAVIDQMIAAVRAHDVLGDCIASCLNISWLARVSALEPKIPRFFSYPPDYGGASRKAWMKPIVDGVVAGMRLTLPLRLERMLRAAPGTNATIYAPLVTRRLVATARRLNVTLFTWTVDDLSEMRRLTALGIDGITSNRPDLLAQLA